MKKILDFINLNIMKPFRFVLIGGIATFVHVVIANCMLLAFQSMSPYLANLIAFTIAFIVSFYGHKYVTFQSEGSVLRFMIVAISGFAINNFILTVILALNFSDIIAVTGATLCVPALTYLASSLWVFKKDK